LSGEPSEFMLIVTAMNTGDRVVRLNTAGFKLPRGETVVIFGMNTSTGLPVDLEDGHNSIAWVEFAELVAQMRRSGYQGKTKVVGFFRSALDVEYSSKPWTIDLKKEK